MIYTSISNVLRSSILPNTGQYRMSITTRYHGETMPPITNWRPATTTSTYSISRPPPRRPYTWGRKFCLTLLYWVSQCGVFFVFGVLSLAVSWIYLSSTSRQVKHFLNFSFLLRILLRQPFTVWTTSPVGLCIYVLKSMWNQRRRDHIGGLMASTILW